MTSNYEQVPSTDLVVSQNAPPTTLHENGSFGVTVAGTTDGFQKINSTGPKFSIFSIQANQKTFAELTARNDAYKQYIETLEGLLKDHGIDLPDRPLPRSVKQRKPTELAIGLIKTGSPEEYITILRKVADLRRKFSVTITYRDLGYWTMAPAPTIPTVGTAFKNIFLGSGPKHRVDLLKGITGRISPGRMTLILGPPGSGKSLLLKALCGRLKVNSKTVMDGSIQFNGENLNSGKFLPPKIADYIEQDDRHAATLTVEETVLYSWNCTSGGHHAYGFAADEAAAKLLEKEDKVFSRMNNMIMLLGLQGCRRTYVGDGTIRGVSGGQKRRVTLAEMVVSPRVAKFLDSVTNGLDSATAFDICQAGAHVCHILGLTTVMSLLQPPPEVYDLFDDIILLSEGQVIYHGPRQEVLPYFESIGYFCPQTVDVADFLQEVPKIEGHRYIKDIEGLSAKDAPRGTTALVHAWKASALYSNLLEEMDGKRPITNIQDPDVEFGKVYDTSKEWPKDVTEPYANTFYRRQVTLTIRDQAFLKARIGQSVIVSAIAGSLFSNIATSDYTTMNGFLFFSVLFIALSGFSMLPIVFAQKEVYYKHADALFFPTSAFTLAQAVVLYPLQMVEIIIFGTIMYWAAGLSDDYNGGRFLTYILILFIFAMCNAQLFRLIAFIMPNRESAAPLAGINVVLQVLFSGFIQPKSEISNGWIWYYWLNPTAYALKAITVNEFKSSAYDYEVATDVTGTSFERFGDLILEEYGNPTTEKWIWYCFVIIFAFYVVFFYLSNLALHYLRTEPTPPPPIIVPDDEAVKDEIVGAGEVKELPFEAVSFAFRDIWYTVHMPGGEELDLLRGVTGFFEPGTVTALMGSSGAGKTTLLDVLSGRKNTGTVRGEMFINGQPKEEHHFRKIMGYVEQFDSLSPHETAREAIEFSAALRLTRDITHEQRDAWVNSVLEMLELTPLENTMVGSPVSGGMSFEQKKRVSIGVELAANPSILFLDEPTTGLDSRAAQIVTRSIRRVASSGRSIVCTIHQPSIPIFTSFDSLLLLRRGGQTVFFGPLGENCEDLVTYFMNAPFVHPIRPRQNPATWMLEVIGAGTGSASGNVTDFHEYYKQSSLCEANDLHVTELCGSPGNSQHVSKHEHSLMSHLSFRSVPQEAAFNSTLTTQFIWLSKKVFTSYWRTPSYNLVRFFINIIIALIFASAYPNYDVTTAVGAVSKSAVMYVTVLFCGVVGLNTVIPVTMAERPAFYREQQSEMYDVAVYTVVTTIVEIPYLILAALSFTIPFFYIVGFQNEGQESDKFGWYWLFQTLYCAVLVYFGQFLVAVLPTAQACDVVAGLMSTILSLFCGFMIKEQDIPTFWLFLYWLNPLHYAIEGLNMSQFHDDSSIITLFSGQKQTAEEFILSYYSTWSYTHIRLDVLALFLFIIFLRVGAYFGLRYLRHDKR